MSRDTERDWLEGNDSRTTQERQSENWNPNTATPDCDWCSECEWCHTI